MFWFSFFFVWISKNLSLWVCAFFICSLFKCFLSFVFFKFSKCQFQLTYFLEQFWAYLFNSATRFKVKILCINSWKFLLIQIRWAERHILKNTVILDNKFKWLILIEVLHLLWRLNLVQSSVTFRHISAECFKIPHTILILFNHPVLVQSNQLALFLL